MPTQSNIPPHWLLQEVGLIDGRFDDNKQAIVGRPNAHNAAVLNVGGGSPPTVRIDLKIRPNWEQIKKRLTDEGILGG